MPFNPTLPRSSVWDISSKNAREGGTDLVIPEFSLAWGDPSFYGSTWDFHKKLALVPDGDLIMADIYHGTLVSMGRDGSLPEEGWNTARNRRRKGLSPSNYLPFDPLRYPYFHFGPDGSLYVSGGQSNYETRYSQYNLEVGQDRLSGKFEFPVEGDRSSYVWKFKLKPGPELEKQGIVGGFKEASGIVVDGDNIIVADAGNNRLRVCTIDGREIASITHYVDKGTKKPIFAPTALAMDRDKCLYVLIGSEERPEDPRTELRKPAVQRVLETGAFQPPEPPRSLIKLKSWKAPELLAKSAPVNTNAMQIAVDAGVTPPIVWLANGSRPGNLQKLSGEDLTIKAQWQDDGTKLSNPRQDSGMSILNIDPETGHVYVEDDASYRSKTYGTVYRLDQKGKILKTWDPFFFDIEESKLISPWGDINRERAHRYPDEHLFIDSIFGRDGRIYRWKLSDDGIRILRFDRAGRPVPFESTGKHELFVDPNPVIDKFPERAHLAKMWTCWWDVYCGMDVDSEGNIYYVEGLLDLISVKGVQVDKDGYLYIVHMPGDSDAYVKRVSRSDPAAKKAFKRIPMRPFALSKFAPTGGEPLWTRPWDGNPGMSLIPPNPHCICSTHRINQALDDKGYVYMAGKHSVQVIDTETGKLVGEFGSYGNIDCKGKGSAYPNPELPFGNISSLAVWKDKLFAMDVVNRRLAKCRIVYDPALKGAK
jgi:sugar lactone lactonase YvrE